MGGMRTDAPEAASVTNEVWSTIDGEVWEAPTTAVPWVPRMGASLVVHGGSMWLMGGKTRRGGEPSSLLADVWRSSDGVVWHQVTESAPWAPRAFHAVVSFAGRLWLLGGGDWDSRSAHSDVWSTADGILWTRHPDAPWSSRIWHGCVVWNGRLLVVGGRQFFPWTRTIWDMWESPDGLGWRKLEPPTNPGPRHAAYVISDSSTVWIMAGSRDGSLYEDCWQLD
jgi:hypothetical protein